MKIRNKRGLTALLGAAQGDHSSVCSLLLSNGSHTEELHPATHSRALHLAATYGHQSTVCVLLSHGAAVDSQDHRGLTPLHVASEGGHLSCVISLLQAGASISLPTIQGDRPIHVAARNNRLAVVETFLSHGCSIEEVSASLPYGTQSIIPDWCRGNDSPDGSCPTWK